MFFAQCFFYKCLQAYFYASSGLLASWKDKAGWPTLISEGTVAEEPAVSSDVTETGCHELLLFFVNY